MSTDSDETYPYDSLGSVVAAVTRVCKDNDRLWTALLDAADQFERSGNSEWAARCREVANMSLPSCTMPGSGEHVPAKMTRWVICDELGKPVLTIRAATQADAIQAFCYPSLREEAYFGPGGGWTCRAEDADP